MIIKYKLVNGNTEYAQTDRYAFNPEKDWHPDILEATLYTDQGKQLHKIKRKRQKYYIEHEYKPLPPQPPKEST